ncbi:MULTISPECIES: acyl-CoA dehydrogenase family protein [Streptomyces]|uniref:Acyl-[acyl-carrier-protein] dehydrogenase MbtN n=1 Tax=Streptomyces tsukubensis (strain DSM 42081 / NBRC 108919 / NRRL 18488 / 9993) TaxID=1114943 RepID=I2N7Q6_STRT9|nr:MULTISPECIES: acyl-CoA dehydrogenase family protein [Streptomyces]AZK96971.1 acyl-CoA dehydrogenase [Streptomyces tsukubensis]EIF93053.1 acyl-CoA dehydrogenase [Streptomyces tsukubensis NRRL18488]MYS66434.1 acyl-CoA dehydrogenase [Streptomyces sp. SID5473]QKM67048.1 acyl-CoA dehydrogenase [Streptomyces tsukubensis NRRL18488]TAI41471.1 acyl-CoA dehydrogenase [Streptomyces tsukubensis]
MKRSIYTEEHEAFRAMIRDFIVKEVEPHFAQWEQDNLVDRDLFRKLGALGVMGFDIPEEYGGAGETSYKYQAIITEESARAAVSFGHYSVSTGIVLPYLLNLANEEQKQRWLPGVAAGELMLCVAMTEPGTGSDLAGIRASAKLSDDGTHYVLNGSKTFITGARNSELCIVAARTSPATPENRRHGLSLFVVPTDSEGFAYGRKLEKIGLRSSDTSELAFNEVKVPVENLLGKQDEGFSYLGQNLPRERLSISVGAVSAATAAIRFAKEYVTERQVFGKPVAAFQNTKFVLAECATEVAALQAMVDQGIAFDDAGELTPADAAKIKLFATETAGRVIDKCLQLHGGYGYMLEYPIARLYADTRVNRIYGGTSEVMKTIIAKDLGL